MSESLKTLYLKDNDIAAALKADIEAAWDNESTYLLL